MAIEVRLLGAEKLVERFRPLPDKAREQLTQGVQRVWFDLQRYVVEEKLSGQVLNRRTGLLAASITAGSTQTATEFEVTSGQIIGRVGTKVIYAAIHEYGGTIVPVNAKALHFKIGDRDIFAQRVNMPERSFLRSSLQENRDRYVEALKQTVRDFVANV